jgi:hypothetical protein
MTETHLQQTMKCVNSWAFFKFFFFSYSIYIYTAAAILRNKDVYILAPGDRRVASDRRHDGGDVQRTVG